MKIKKIIFVILSALIFAIMLAVLELNKNTVWGFVLLLLVTAGFYTAHRFIVKRKNKWYLRLCVWLAWLSLFCGVLFLTWPPVQAVPAVIQEIRYFSTYNFIGDRIDGYEEPCALLTKEAARALRTVSNELLVQGYRLRPDTLNQNQK